MFQAACRSWGYRGESIMLIYLQGVVCPLPFLRGPEKQLCNYNTVVGCVLPWKFLGKIEGAISDLYLCHYVGVMGKKDLSKDFHVIFIFP